MNRFWKNWLTVWCWGVLAFGVVLALAASPATDAAPRVVLALIGGDPAVAAILDEPAGRFAYGLLGAVTMGWALTLMVLCTLAHAVGSAQAWRAVTGAVLSWYVIDSAISVMLGFPLNAVSNTLIAALFLAPVLGSGVMRGDGRPVAA